MERKNVVIAFKNGVLYEQAWGNTKDCCEALEVPYWSIITKKSPVSYKEFVIVKLPFRIKNKLNDRVFKAN